MKEKIAAGKNTVYLFSDGLNPGQFALLKEISSEVFSNSLKEWEHSLDRCNIFGEHGYKHLVKAIEGKDNFGNPRIEGCDNNAFDQHYWLGVDLKNQDNEEAVIIDPIFGYVGLQKYARQFAEYYKNKRIVTPGVSRSESGIRMKTIGI